MTTVLYCDNLEDYIRVIIRNEVLDEYKDCIIKYKHEK